MTVLHPPGFRTAVRSRVECEGENKDPDEAIIIITRLKEEWHIIEKYEEGRKEASCKG